MVNGNLITKAFEINSKVTLVRYSKRGCAREYTCNLNSVDEEKLCERREWNHHYM